ncbi:MAG: hypothetical protein GYA17_08075 [Chloroflexi bacterium]|jgi:hypothetical protein|nr:hypothetical protein [Anaerolineaceae bacterium]NMB88304.1 hypothetical protein [Chloroflexota bacterium]
MQERNFWSKWANFLQRWGLREPAAAFLEAAGPLSILLAQFIYFGKPFLGKSVSSEQLHVLTDLFEDREKSQQFAAYLRREEDN